MKQSFVATLLAVCLAGVVHAQYVKAPPEWNKPVTPHRVIANIYFVGTNEISSFLITSPQGHILLDAAFDESVPMIKANVERLGFKYADIKVLLNSQAHYDHAAGLAAVKRDTHARMEAMGGDAALLEAGGKDDFRFGNEFLFPPVKVDRILRDGDVVEQGGVKLTARHTPGHTKGATTFVTSVEDGGRRYEVVFATSITVNPGTLLVNNPKYPNIASDWEKTYAILKSLKPDVWVGGHTGFFDMAGKSARVGQTPNPYIDPQGYARWLAEGEARYRKQLAVGHSD